ncbi:excinuclease ATPase subunit [Noviherbaspirillum sedimenti]|uniref:Excinuclease ATPase subunit n=1 Tax=Noviherbaspirillum sedimenti TaxID=2320865 RepID=A0A3A3GTX6_9BURK|nr:excinuclease ATPase subunit [Noviherbaspirillum sedimenti]
MSSFVVLGAALTAVSYVQARDTKLMLPIAAAMETPDTQEKLVGSVKFYFGDQKPPKVLGKLGSDFSNRKTNAFGKSDETACNWAFLSALMALEQRAISLGANAVVNVASYYKKNTHSSQTEFECHAGALMAGVALKGDFVKIADK